MTDPVDRLLELFTFDELGDDVYRAVNVDRGHGTRVFGGQVAAQALAAATRTITVPHHLHSLHAYFLRPGRPGIPIDYDVEETRDGRSFTTRRVLGRQDGEVIFEMSCSFHGDEDGVDYQLPRATDVPPAEDTPARMLWIPDEERERIPFELRELGPSDADDTGWHRSTRRVWMRIRRRLPDDPLLHACLITFLSDMGAVMAAMAPVPEHRHEQMMAASLDHALWFHRPIRADEWMLYDLHAVSNHGARGLTRGTMHTEDGVLGVSVAQEALIRVLNDRQQKNRSDGNL
ncbi:MAG: thioesterase family protein [Actinobacteria bacterium]|nr:thioesterase family protein [Actinomycetota bacterium]